MLANKHAQEAISFGFSPIPLNGKIPIVSKWQLLTDEELSNKVLQHNGNIGIRTGKWSNVIILDCDKPRKNSNSVNGLDVWDSILNEHDPSFKTVSAMSGSESMHFYFKYDPSLNLQSKIEGSIDILSDNKQCVYPGSIYPGCGSNHKCGSDNDEICLYKGNEYKWVISPDDMEIKEIPKWLIPYIIKPNPNNSNYVETAEEFIPTDNKELVEFIFDNLSLKRWECCYDDWIKLVWLMVKYNIPTKQIHDYAQLCPKKYNKQKLDELINDYDESKCTSTLGPKSWIIQWLREDLLEKAIDEDDNSLKEAEESVENIIRKLFISQTNYNIRYFIGDSEIAELFYNIYAKDNIKTVNASGICYEWNDLLKLWEEKEPIFIKTKIYDIISPIMESQLEKYQKDDDEFKIIQSSLFRIRRSVSRRGILEPLIPLTYDKEFPLLLNRQIDELPIKNGYLLNLKTLETRPRTRHDLFTFELSVTYKPPPYKIADEYFSSLASNDVNLKDYIQKVLGYCFTGSCDLKCMFIFWGNGSNGKSMLIDILKNILKSFYTTIDEKVLIKKERTSSCTPELVPLVNSRLAILNETNNNDVLDGSRVKAISGLDSISVNPKYKDVFEFIPMCKMVLLTNNKPGFNPYDTALTSRIKLIPFTAKFDVNKKNTSYINDLRTKHIDEIFSWIVSGSKIYYNTKNLGSCVSVDNHMKEYIAENDYVSQFIEELCDVDKDNTIGKSILYKNFYDWSTDKKLRIINQHDFVKIMDSLGYKETRVQKVRSYKGISL